MLDLDTEAKAIPSSTPGHWHLWFDGVEMSWELYKELLDMLARCGILDRAYIDHSIERGHTAVWLPHVPKTANGSSSRTRYCSRPEVDFEGWPRGLPLSHDRQATRRFRSRRSLVRSRALSPPSTPTSSRFASAHSRHSSRTGRGELVLLVPTADPPCRSPGLVVPDLRAEHVRVDVRFPAPGVVDPRAVDQVANVDRQHERHSDGLHIA